jgi:hypothetical protein
MRIGALMVAALRQIWQIDGTQMVIGISILSNLYNARLLIVFHLKKELDGIIRGVTVILQIELYQITLEMCNI